MDTAICTLFENHYHHGVAALINSLYKHGFRGSVFAGYKGELPKWASSSKENKLLEWQGAHTLIVTDDFKIHFLPIITEYHLTNYKPNFMLRLWDSVTKDADAIVYFDPDIVIKCGWSFFESWMQHGVGLCHEIISNDMPPTHPLRREWEKVIESSGKKKTRDLYSYINGGFCGVRKENIEFLYTWVEIFDTGIKNYNLTAGQWQHAHNRTYIFYAQDQDALNIAAMCSESPISEMGPEAMDFNAGGWTMSHAVGTPKPWNKKFILSSLKGNSPSRSDKEFWLNVHEPLKLFNKIKIKQVRLSILVGSFIGRFYRRY